MGDYISEKEMKELQKFTKERQKEDTEMIKNKIKESIPSKKNIEKAKEIVEPEINCIEDTPRYKEGTKEQKRFLRDLCTLVTKGYVAKTKVYDTYTKDVKETLELFYTQIGKAMPVKEVQTYLLRDYHYRVFIEYLKETTGFNIERNGEL